MIKMIIVVFRQHVCSCWQYSGWLRFLALSCGVYISQLVYFAHICRLRLGFMVFNASFNTISVIFVLLVEETGVPGGNHRPVAGH